MIALWLAWLGLASADCTVLGTATESATFHLPQGASKAPNALVLVDGRVAALGPHPQLGADPKRPTWQGRPCAWVEVGGKHVSPGLIDPHSQVGLVEISGEESARHHDAGGPPIRASFRAADAYDPRSTVIPVTRIAGLTSVIAAPVGGRVSGQAAWAQLAGATQAEAVVDRSVAVVANLEGASHAQGLAELRELLAEARFYQRNRAAWERNASRALAVPAGELEALQRVLSGDQPLLIAVDRASDIEATLRFARDEGVRVVLLGAAEGWLLAEALAAARVPVIVNPLLAGPGGFDQRQARSDNAALLAGAGVPVMFTVGWTPQTRTLPQVAGNAVRSGLSHDQAMAAVTRVPADVFGVTDRGRLAPGAVADVVVWSGDPFETSTRVEGLWIEGRSIPLVSRQTLLRDRYAELPPR